MSTARFSADAEADLLAIVEFIAQDNPNAAREWLRERHRDRTNPARQPRPRQSLGPQQPELIPRDR
jgi:plasmid stabilization system protein ParE